MSDSTPGPWAPFEHDLRKELSDINSRLTGIETKLDERCETRGATIDHLQKRVRTLEINQAKVAGAAAILSVLFSQLLKGLLGTG